MILVVSLTHYITVTLLLTGMAGPCTAGLHPAMVSIYCAGLKRYYGSLGNIVGCVTALWSIITKGLLRDTMSKPNVDHNES